MAEPWTMQRAMSEPPPLFHPLAGCDWKNFQAHLRSHAELSPRTAAQRSKSRLAVIARQPFTLAEKLIFSGRVERYRLPHPPLFLIGHWRSGTTHLHNLMSATPLFSTIDFGQTAMPHNLLNPTRFIGRAVLSSVIPKDRGIDNVRLGIREPQEEEMALGNLNPVCYYNAYYYPLEMKEQFDRAIFLEGLSAAEIQAFESAYVRLLKKLSLAGGGRPLLLKNPASTARLALLGRLFEGARFIHIVRNPFEVFASMLHHYPRVLHAFAWQRFDGLDLEEMVFYKYRRLMQGYLSQKATANGRLIETSYEKIIADPVGEISRFFDHFGLEGRDQALRAIERHAQETRNYQRNRYQLTRAQVKRIEAEWAFSFEKWGYGIPDSIRIV